MIETPRSTPTTIPVHRVPPRSCRRRAGRGAGDLRRVPRSTPPGSRARAPMAFDYSLHARHVKALEDKCENCHHVWDEAAEKLKYEKGKEEGCRACHGAEDEDRKLSLANASHRSCVSCHLERAATELEAGPVLCVGCHDQEHHNAYQEAGGSSAAPARPGRHRSGSPRGRFEVAVGGFRPSGARAGHRHSVPTATTQTLKPATSATRSRARRRGPA